VLGLVGSCPYKGKGYKPLAYDETRGKAVITRTTTPPSVNGTLALLRTVSKGHSQVCLVR